jgi:EmrB/QacA subfamily drug resistance transporter
MTSPDDLDAHLGDAWKTLALSGLAVLAIFLDTTILFVAFPDIVRSFPSVGPAALSWVLNAYTITFAALLVPAGKLADRLGHKRAFLAGSTVFTAASLLCAIAPGPLFLVVFRVVQAAGGATLIPSSLALVMRAFPREKLPVAVAIWGATGALAGALGPTLGAALVEVASWRWVFLLNLPVGIVTVWFGRRILTESRDPDTQVPAPAGIVLVAAAAASLSLGVVQSERWGWLDWRTVAALTGGVVLLAAFWAQQRRTSAPALDLELFGIRNVAWANLATLAYGAAFAAMFFGSVLFLTDVWGWSILAAGFGVAPGPALVAVLAPRAGRLAARYGQRPLILAGALVYAFGGWLRIALLTPHSDYLRDYLPSMLCTAVGVALVLPQLSSAVAQALPPNRLGVGAGLNQAIRQFGATFGVAFTIALLSGATGDAIAAFDRVWWFVVVGGLATAACAIPLRTRDAGTVAPVVSVDPAPAPAPG